MKNIVSFTRIFLTALFAVCLFSGAAVAQIQFQRDITVSPEVHETGLIQTTDSAYVMVGYTGHFPQLGSQVVVIKMDRSGNLLWKKTIGGTVNDVGIGVTQTTDGNYVVAGYSSSFTSNNFNWIYIVKIDPAGNILWSKIMAGFSTDYGTAATSITHTPDGGCAVTAISGPQSGQFCILKLDVNGNIQWNRFIGGLPNSAEYDCAVINTSDGGYALAGYGLTEVGGGTYYIHIVKLDVNGSVQWNSFVGETSQYATASSIIQTSDGGYALAGVSKNIYSYNVGYILKLNSAGNLQWTKTVGATDLSSNCEFNSIIQTPDGEYSALGYADPVNFHKRFCVARLDENGNLLWTRTLDDSSPTSNFDEVGNTIIQAKDNGYALAGYTNRYNAGDISMFIIKLDENWETCSGTTLRQFSTGTFGSIQSPTPTIISPPLPHGPVNSVSNPAGTFTAICDGITLPGPIIIGLIDYVHFYINTGLLNEGNGNSLLVKLNAASRNFENGHNEAAADHLEAFIDRLGSLVRTHHLTMGQAQPMIDLANNAITSLGGGESKPRQEVTKDFLLKQNYPNPFNPSTSINYIIPKTGNVKIVVYDVLGNEIITLINENISAGEHEVKFDGTNLASGVYFYRIEAGSFTEIKKMLLIK